MSTPNKKNSSALKNIISFTYPKLYTGKEWYVGFYAFDPAIGEMRRKRIKINFITGKISDRRHYADGLIRRICEQLDNGWNPWIEADDAKAYHLFTAVCEHYRRYITKLYNDDYYRIDTFQSYRSYLRNIELYNESRKVPITYIYQFNREFLINFLEYIYIDRENTPQTRDNYLAFAKVFSQFLVENAYLQIGRASCRERVQAIVLISSVTLAL